MEIKETDSGLKVSMELLTDEEIRQINNNMDDIVHKYTQEYIANKEMAVAQHIMATQQETIDSLKKENQDLKNEIHNLNERLEKYIPRRRVRRIYKALRTILEIDIQDERKESIEHLKYFIKQIEEYGPTFAGQDIKRSIEHLIGTIDLED